MSISEHASQQRPPGDRIARHAGLTGAATLASRVLGLVRDQVIAAFFGAGNDMDAFVVAFRIPNLVRDLFAEGAMSAAFVPTFTRELTRRGKPQAWRLGNNRAQRAARRHRRAGRRRHRVRAAADWRLCG
jgi:putative peptidoglycan lipid II flippase